MRLTGGFDRGRRLKAPRGAQTRPTSAKVREAIFNILGPAPETAVLDLFAGTGALGIEALSRGAPRAVFVERSARALDALRRNLRELQLEDRSHLIASDVRAALRQLASRGERFDWVFVDPPYAAETGGVWTLGELSGSEILNPCAVVVVEHDKRHRPAETVGELILTDRRGYGDTEVSFFRFRHRFDTMRSA